VHPQMPRPKPPRAGSGPRTRDLPPAAFLAHRMPPVPQTEQVGRQPVAHARSVGCSMGAASLGDSRGAISEH
jgi:hypothetical protein